MKRLFNVGLMLLLVALAVPAQAARRNDLAGEAPPVLYTSLSYVDPAYPTFVAADAAVTTDGQLSKRLFHPQIRTRLRRLLASPPESGCVRFGPIFVESPTFETFDLAKATQRSDLVMTAKVVAREYGFHFSEAGQLLEIEAQEVLKGSAPLSRYYIFLPVGQFSAGPYRICKSDHRYISPPRVGSTILILVPEIEDPGEPFLDIVLGENLIAFEKGEARMPASLSPDREQPVFKRPAAEVLSTVRGAIGGVHDDSP